MTTPTLRRGTGADDAAIAADVYIRSRHNAVPAIPPMVHPDDDVRRYWAEELFVSHEVWLADDAAGQAMAVMALQDDWVDQLYVAPGCTGDGVGTALLNLAKQRQPEGLRLWAFQSNVDARRFYERHGFIEVDSTTGDNEEHAPDVLYKWTPRSV